MSWFSKQVEQRRRFDQQELEDSYACLAASVLGSGRAPRFTVDDAAVVDDALASVLAFYGATPAEIPADVTEPMERIECAIRPTGLMKRSVRLEGDWWRNAIGAYLGKLEDGTPLALIPLGARGYCYTDPVSKTKVVVNKRTASMLSVSSFSRGRTMVSVSVSLSNT